ncbi:MAG: DapH/DapD/GlmU-related protein [Bacillota bacterium]|nr:DapH/DapD/GlmU-related protein [Bacillota bacterium]
MEKIYISTRDLSELFLNDELRKDYRSVQAENRKRNDLVLKERALEGCLILPEELFFADLEILTSLLEEAHSSKRSFVAYHDDSTLFIFLTKERAAGMEISEKTANSEDLLRLLESDSDLEKLSLDEDIAYRFDSVRGLSMAAESLNAERVEGFLRKGVYLRQPSTVSIGPEVTIEDGAVIGSGVVLEGRSHISKNVVVEENVTIIDSKIGASSKIGAGTYIINSEIHEGVNVMSSRIADSVVCKGCNIGPFAHLRPNSKLGENVKIGNFVEIKNSALGEGTKVSHLSYIGDSDLGSKINVGCGVVFVNYNGVEKFRSQIEDDVFIGCNANIVSPVHIGRGAFIAAGSTITEDVGEEQLAIARARQTNKDGWSIKKAKEN